MEDCLAKAERGGGDVLRTVMFYILSTQPEKGLEIGLQYVKGNAISPQFSITRFKLFDVE